MKIASYNVQNLFDRAKALNEDTPEAKEMLKLEAELNGLFDKPIYTAANKKRMLDILGIMGLLKKDEGTYVYLRKLKGQFIKRAKSGDVEIVASGREDWVGWVELKTEQVEDIAIMNTGRVIKDVNADIIAVVEAENRVALKQFSDYVLKKLEGSPYDNIMLIDGNDERGIDVGLMTKANYNIGLMRSHIHDMNPAFNGPVFSRDCPEYCIETPEGEHIWILPNHFKSKFGGDNPKAKEKRKAQATRVAEIYKKLIKDGNPNVIVLGDLNDTPESDLLKPLLEKTDLKDISKHPSFDNGGYNGTFGSGGDRDKIDYILLSPALFSRVVAGGIFRKGAWPGIRKPKWEVYPELTKERYIASDHHLIWCEISKA